MKSELKNIIQNSKNFKSEVKKLLELQQKISTLTFLDPACGSGNFLTETYLSLRRLENEILKRIIGTQITLGEISNPIKVSIGQFYGIEINDFAVTVAKTALWIAESQMMIETEAIVHKNFEFLPLKSYTNITENNALTTNWQTIITKVDYIFGNPPFVWNQTEKQKSDILSLCKDLKSLDYVTGWYYKAAEFIQNTSTKVAFVSTNSITQGEQVAPLWKNLKGIHIDFAYRTFKWESESNKKAQVHVVIIGFSSLQNDKSKIIFNGDEQQIATNINGYLIDAPNVFIERRSDPICDVPKMITGNRPADGGNLIIEAEDYDEFVKKEPNAKKYIKNLIGAKEFINNLPRYCLWLVGANPSELKKMPLVMKRVEACKRDRLKGAADRKKLSETPTLFRETINPKHFIVVPCTSSELRKYIPIGFLDENYIPTNSVLVIPDTNLYHFGILKSSVHMAWTRTVCGRLKSDYRYSKDIVYNNFVWCAPTEKQRQEIEQTAKKILDARKLYPESSLADLYNDTIMPAELRKAHQANDKAVMKAYGFDLKMTESEIVAELMKMYERLTKA